MATSRRPRRTTTRTTSPTTRPSRRTPTTVPADTPERSMDMVDWREEYAYVFQDLRKLGIITVSIFALLLIIGFFL